MIIYQFDAEFIKTADKDELEEMLVEVGQVQDAILYELACIDLDETDEDD